MYGFDLKVTDNDRVGPLLKALREELATKNCFNMRIDYMFNEYRDVNLPFSDLALIFHKQPQWSKYLGSWNLF